MNKRRDNSVSNPTPRVAFDRLAVARISSGIGALAIVVAILAYLLQREITLMLLVSTLIGIGGLGLWLVLAPDDLRAVVTGRRAAHSSNSIFNSVLVIGSIAIVYTLSVNSGIAADMTTVGYYSLKTDAKSIVANVNRPLQITAFYNPSRLSDRTLDMPILQMFADAAPDKIKLVVVDPDEQTLLARKLGLIGSSGIFISYLDQAGQPDPAFTVQTKGAYAREPWIAEAILQLQARGKYRLLFTIGHDEIDTDVEKKAEAYGIRAGADNVGILTGTLDLKNEDIPRDTSAIVVLRPQRDFSENEVAKIAKYMADGGKLLIMAKPAYISSFEFMTSPDSPMSKYLWETWGIRPQQDIVFDPSAYIENPYRVLASSVSKHPILNRDAAGTTQVRPLLTIAQSWEIANDKPASVTTLPLIMSSAKSIGKTNLPKVATNPDDPSNLQLETGDIPGPLVMAAALENSQNNARLIVIGDADWVYNDLVIQFDGMYLWTNMVDWLTQYLSNITVTPKIRELPLIVDTGSLNIVLIISVVILPGLVLLTGGVVWWNRRRQ
jgi:ABC-2 type transport system permease protein